MTLLTDGWKFLTTQRNYTIYFENDAELATAAAQRVNIVQELDPSADPYSFRLGNFGFAGLNFEVPSNRLNYTQLLDLPDSLGYDVQVTAGLNILDNTVFWELQAIDPYTGLAPADPYLGFLPINDSTGIGEGYVYYTIKPKTNAMTGDSLQAQATIVFGINDPIRTNTWTNYLDAFAPTTTIAALPLTIDTTAIMLDLSGLDDAGGVGLDYYTLYVAEDGGPFLVAEDSIYSSIYTYTGNDGSSYEFFVLGTDYVGNTEALKLTAEVSTTIERDKKFDLKIYLEGAYLANADSMTTELLGVLPLTQPYNAPPWNYKGNESITSLALDITDWVLVTLRTEASNSTVIDTLAALLRSDGKIVSTNGDQLSFDRNLNGIDSLFIAVYHRNHVGVLSAKKVGHVNNVFTHDYTTANAVFGGISGSSELEVNVFGLISGDFNANSQVQNTDFNLMIQEIGVGGYRQGDFDMNTQVQNTDLQDHLFRNIGRGAAFEY